MRVRGAEPSRGGKPSITYCQLSLYTVPPYLWSCINHRIGFNQPRVRQYFRIYYQQQSVAKWTHAVQTCVTQGSTLPLEKAMAPHSSTLAWRIPRMEEPGRLQSMGSRRVGHDFTFTFHFHALEKEMATHSRVLAWRIPGTGEPGGLPSMGSHTVGHD